MTEDETQVALGQYIEILEDPTGKLTISDVASSDYDAQFVRSTADVPNYGFTESAYWVRLTLDNRSAATADRLLELGSANMYYVDLYTPSPDGAGYAAKQTGALRPPSTRDIAHPHIVFEIAVPPMSEQSIYLRFESDRAMMLPLTLWAPPEFYSTAQRSHMLHGLFFGALLILLAHNMFLFFSLRDKAYLYLVMLLASMIAFEAGYSGYLDLYILPQAFNLKPYIQTVTFPTLFVSMLLFTDAFLELKVRLPQLHWVVIVVGAVWGALLMAMPFVDNGVIASLAVPWALPSLLTILTAGTISWLQGFRYAKTFMIAWSGLLAAFCLTLMIRLGLIPSSVSGESAYRVGLMWMAVCWSLALTDRINFLQQATQEANQALQSSQRRLSQILEALPLGVVVYGKNQRPSYINRQISKIMSNPARNIQPDLTFGRTLTEAMEYYALRINRTEESYPLEKLPIYRALHGEPASVDDVEVDLVDRRVPLEIWANPMRNAAGEVEGAVVAIKDITQRKETEEKLQSYRNQLEELVEQRTGELMQSNERLHQEIAERQMLEEVQEKLIEWLSAVNEAQQSLTGRADLPRAYEALITTIGRLMDAQSIFLCTWDAETNQATFQYYVGADGADATYRTASIMLPADQSPRQELEQGELVTAAADQLGGPFAPFAVCLGDARIRSVVLAPIVNMTEVIGCMGLGLTVEMVEITDEEATMLSRMGLDLATLATYAELYEAAKELVASDERNRLARDLHDSVTQVLFSATLVAEILPDLWRRNPDKAMVSLDNLRRLTYSALAELRTMLLELRPTAIANTPLPELLAQLTEAITARNALPFQLSLEQMPTLPADVHGAFYRIAQEALNNVLKHAQASRVSISLSAMFLGCTAEGDARHEIKLIIRDDGIGYDASVKHPGHLGLDIMRERAAAIDARLTLQSEPGSGTSVTLSWINIDTSQGADRDRGRVLADLDRR